MEKEKEVKVEFHNKTCVKCGRSQNSSMYVRSKSFLFPDKRIPICNECLEEMLVAHKFDWDYVDKLCQYVDIPFVPKEFERLKDINGTEVFPVYANMYFASEYEGIGWKDYYDAYMDLKEQGGLEEVVPILGDTRRRELQEKWGFNYDDGALNYLESLYDGLLLTQNISGALQGDQAVKICKISYEIDCRIREGEDFDKLLASYDKLVKTGEFTPKNVKNASDFESTGELFRWLEKRGWKNRFYDGVTRDEVDETLKNIQNWNQRLYTNETGIGDEINQRIRSLRSAAELEGYYNIDNDGENLDEYDNQGYVELFKEEEEEDFKIALDEDGDK